ncbi:MAG: hypothetical protein HN350_06910 [Phycisphaerales bacterium]|nr:hypothetical protein [Phycisphaerales bacterium]
MAAIIKIVLLIVLAVGALSMAGCGRHRFHHQPRHHSRIQVVHDRHRDRCVDVRVTRAPSHHGHDRHHGPRRGRR